MHGLSRLGNGVNSPSPPSSPRFRHGRSKNTAFGGVCGSFPSGNCEVKLQNFAEKLGFMIISAIYRRRGVLLFAPLLYISGMLLYMGAFSFDTSGRSGSGTGVVPLGSGYRSPQVFEKLWPLMEAENNGNSNLVPRIAKVEWLPHNQANGGLNQQRLSVCSFEFCACSLPNATLVIPIFHLNSVRRDSRAVRIAPFSNRLAHSVPPNIQGLRCLCNFEALRFSEPIRMLAAKMVDRMVKKSSKISGRYVSVHIRFEEDMIAFSCCTYDGGEEEKHEMDIARERSWRGKFRRRGRVIRPGANRIDGKCPLTPLEGHSSRLAALDYTVCLYSEAFVPTQGGNFPHFLVGHRRYLYDGHAKTIKPDKRKLSLLFDSPDIRWKDFKSQLQDMLRHSDAKGIELRKPNNSLYTFPMPDCMCKHADVKNTSGYRRRLL
ncbi:unnamed protein product [Withania somnifera]